MTNVHCKIRLEREPKVVSQSSASSVIQQGSYALMTARIHVSTPVGSSAVRHAVVPLFHCQRIESPTLGSWSPCPLLYPR